MKKRLITALAITSILVFSGLANADVVFTTSDTQTMNGTVGVIAIEDGEHKAFGRQATGFDGDTVVFAYDNGGKLVVVDRYFGGNDTIYLYEDTTNLSSKRSAAIDGISNTKDVAYMNGNLYFLSENGRVTKVAPSTLTAVGDIYEPDGGDLETGFIAGGASLAVLGGELYALYSLRDEYYTDYADSILVRLDADLKKAGIAKGLGKNAHTVLASGNNLYVASYGGVQISLTDPADSKLEKVTAGSMDSSVLFTASDMNDGGLIASIGLDETGSVSFFATHKIDQDWIIEAANVYKISNFDPTSKKTIKSKLKGFYTFLAYDDVTKLVWVASSTGRDGSDQLMAFDSSTLVEKKSFSAADLGGPVYSIATVRKTDPVVHGGGGGGGGGCTSGSFGGLCGTLLILLALLAPLSRVTRAKSES